MSHADKLRDLSVFSLGDKSMNDESVRSILLAAAEEISRLETTDRDLKNVLKAALYNEPNGIELVNRLTTFAIEQRNSQ